MATATLRDLEAEATLFDGTIAMAETLIAADDRITIQDDSDEEAVILAVDTGNGIANAYAAWYIMEIGGVLSTDTQANIEARWTIPI